MHAGGIAPGCRHVNPRICTTVKASAYKGMTMCVLVSLVKNTRLPVASLPGTSNFLHPPALPWQFLAWQHLGKKERRGAAFTWPGPGSLRIL